MSEQQRGGDNSRQVRRFDLRTVRHGEAATAVLVLADGALAHAPPLRADRGTMTTVRGKAPPPGSE